MRAGTLHVNRGRLVDGNRRVNGVVQSERLLDFAGALTALKAGARVARRGWNGTGMFLYLVPGSTFHVSRKPLLGIYPRGKRVQYRPHIDMVCADGKIVPWLASQTDLLEEDWVVVAHAADRAATDEQEPVAALAG
jgi:hypothetical protein